MERVENTKKLGWTSLGRRSRSNEQQAPETRKECPGQQTTSCAIVTLPLEAIKPSPYQPRLRPLGRKDLVELMAAIASAGQLTPIIVSPTEEANSYYVHSGHRRVAALGFLGINRVKAEIRADLTESEARS